MFGEVNGSFLYNLNMKSKAVSLFIMILTFMVSITTIIDNNEKVVLFWNESGDILYYGPTYIILFYPLVSTFVYMMWFGKKKKNYKSKWKSLTPLILIIILYITLCSTKILNMEPVCIFVVLLLLIIFYFIG